ncbi:MAG: hypothetical protein ACYTHM_13410 [Planctomycetota bacterium]|jgi:hypothetical protein
MSSIVDTLQILERVMEYKRASFDICQAAARHSGEDAGALLSTIAQTHDAHLKQIPLIFKHIEFSKSGSAEETPLTEIRTGLFQDLGMGATLNLVGAAIRVEQEALRLLQSPLERAKEADLKNFLEMVVQNARQNIKALQGINPPKSR